MTASLCRCLSCGFTAVFEGKDHRDRRESRCPACDGLLVVLRPCEVPEVFREED